MKSAYHADLNDPQGIFIGAQQGTEESTICCFKFKTHLHCIELYFNVSLSKLYVRISESQRALEGSNKTSISLPLNPHFCFSEAMPLSKLVAVSLGTAYFRIICYIDTD